MTSEFAYPKRPKFFSHKFCRVMWKCCLANEIGNDVCWLLSGIVMTEDAKGYRSAVTYYNEQLYVVAGYGSVDAMARARAKAIKAGWLAYKPGGKGYAGKYYVMIPKEHQDWDDLPTDEGSSENNSDRKNAEESANDSPEFQCDECLECFNQSECIRTSAEESANNPRDNREASAEESAKNVRKNPRSKCGTIFPIPNPVPNPIQIHSEPAGSDDDEKTNPDSDNSEKPKRAAREKKPEQDQPWSAEICPLPHDLTEFVDSWGQWTEARKSKNKPVTNRMAKGTFEKFKRHGLTVSEACECINESIANGWQGLFPEKIVERRAVNATGRPLHQTFRQTDRNEADRLIDQLYANATDSPARIAASTAATTEGPPMISGGRP